MSNISIIRDILLKIEKLNIGETILIDDLAKEFSELSEQDFLKIISILASRYFVKVDGKYSHESHTIEKYNKIVGLDKEGYEGLDAIRNEKIWNKVEAYLKDYNDFSIFTAIGLAKKVIEKEFDDLINE